MNKVTIITALVAVASLSADPAFARSQGYTYSFQQPTRSAMPPSYYQPRVYSTYQVPRPYAGQAEYMLGGGVAGLAATRGNGYAGVAGAYAGQKLYDYQAQYGGRTYQSPTSSYYYAPAYGIQTTTPYMVRPNPNYR
jgi:hypothetical protein